MGYQNRFLTRCSLLAMTGLLLISLLGGCGDSDDDGVVVVGQDGGIIVAALAVVSNGADTNVRVFNIDLNTGELTNVAGSPVAAGGPIGQIRIHPSQAFVYGTDLFGTQVYGFSLASNGDLALLPGFPIDSGMDSTFGVAIDASGNFLYIGDDNQINGYSINQGTGAITQLGGFPQNHGGAFAFQLVFDATNSFLYVADAATSSIPAFNFNGGTGALTPIAGSPFASGGGGTSIIQFDETNQFLYAVNDGTNDITGFSVDQNTGSLTALAGFPVATSGNGFHCGFQIRDGVFYVSDGGQGTDAYTVGADGSLTPIAGFPFASPGCGLSLVDGLPFLLQTSPLGGVVNSFTVNADATLTANPNSPINAGTQPGNLQTAVYTN